MCVVMFVFGFFGARNEDWKLCDFWLFSRVVGAMTSEKSGNPGPWFEVLKRQSEGVIMRMTRLKVMNLHE